MCIFWFQSCPDSQSPVCLPCQPGGREAEEAMRPGVKLSVHLPCSLTSAWEKAGLCSVTSVMPNSLQPHELEPNRLLCPWHSPARTLQWVAMPSCRGSSQPRDRNCIPPALQVDFLPTEPPGSPKIDTGNSKTKYTVETGSYKKMEEFLAVQ